MNGKKAVSLPVGDLNRSILDQIPAMVFAMDREYNLILVNEAGRKWSGKKLNLLVGTRKFLIVKAVPD